MYQLDMDPELLYTGVKVAAMSGPEGGSLAVGDRVHLGNLLYLVVWVWWHGLAGVRDWCRGLVVG